MELYDGAVYKMEEGEIVFKGHLRNGLFHGRYEEYHSRVDSLSSRGYERGTYEYGHREGGFEVYESVGKLSEKGRYLRGVRHGPYLAYHDNMSLWIKTEYIAGRWEGPYESFDRKGNLVAKGHYKKNSQCGLWVQEGEMVEYPPC
jgi:antitoxin component YwqK of YwqJK toxin-antitoxin module